MPTFTTASWRVKPAVSRAQRRISGFTAGIDFRNRVAPDRNSDELSRRGDHFVLVFGGRHYLLGLRNIYLRPSIPCGPACGPIVRLPQVAVVVMWLGLPIRSVSASLPQCDQSTRSPSDPGGSDPFHRSNGSPLPSIARGQECNCPLLGPLLAFPGDASERPSTIPGTLAEDARLGYFIRSYNAAWLTAGDLKSWSCVVGPTGEATR